MNSFFVRSCGPIYALHFNNFLTNGVGACSQFKDKFEGMFDDE